MRAQESLTLVIVTARALKPAAGRAPPPHVSEDGKSKPVCSPRGGHPWRGAHSQGGTLRATVGGQGLELHMHPIHLCAYVYTPLVAAL